MSCGPKGCASGRSGPITLWPFPGEALAAGHRAVPAVLVYELNAGQMVDDVRMRAPTVRSYDSIGGVSQEQRACGRATCCPTGAPDARAHRRAGTRARSLS